MARLSLLLLSFALVFLGGCKIQIVVPVGGKVTTQSGDYTCVPGKPCDPVEILDLFFDQTFIAQPDEGYRFSHWKERERGFCANDPKPCHIVSSLMSLHEALQALLESDEVFYLEPVFVKSSGGGGGGTQNASVCYSTEQSAIGFTLEANYISVDTLSGERISFHQQTTLAGNANFNGRQVLRSTTRMTTSADPTFVSNVISYFLSNNSTMRTTNFGSESEITAGGIPAGSVTTLFTPGLLIRFDLAPGQSFSQTYTIDITQRFGGLENTSSQRIQQTNKFIGVVTVTVPAGTYQACKFEEVTSVTVLGFTSRSTRTIWIAVGNGVNLKEINDSSTVELESAKVNGVKI